LAVIKPFKGITYNRELVADPGSLITPPYDVIDPDEQEKLHRHNPYNVIRLEYGKTDPQDTETENRYTRAKAVLRQWLESGVLRPERDHNLYVHEQSFQWQGTTLSRFGIMAALKLEPYSSGLVLPHEQTMAGPKEDRFQLLKHTGANFSPIFGLFPDPEPFMDSFREQVVSQPPAFETTDSSGQNHRLWLVNDRKLIAGFTACLAGRPVLIADGHHRYETALHYSRKSNLNRLPGAGYVLVTLVGASDSGLLMLPAHRLVSGLAKEQYKLIERLIEENYNFLDRGRPQELNRAAFREELDRLGPESGALGYIAPSGAALLVPRRKPAAGDLPVTVLHERLLDPALAAGANRNLNRLNYTHDASRALESVMRGEAEKAFIIGSMPVDKILERASRGMLMPQKSTYFYPKLPGGLVIYHTALGGVELDYQ